MISGVHRCCRTELLPSAIGPLPIHPRLSQTSAASTPLRTGQVVKDVSYVRFERVEGPVLRRLFARMLQLNAQALHEEPDDLTSGHKFATCFPSDPVSLWEHNLGNTAHRTSIDRRLA